MKIIIILLLVFLLSVCSAVKPPETLSSMQTKPTTETTVTEMATPEKTTEATPKETETVIEATKAETTASSVDEQLEQKPAPNTTTVTTAEAPADLVKTETRTEPPMTQETPVETVKEEQPTEIPETVETPPESVTEPPKAELDMRIEYYSLALEPEWLFAYLLAIQIKPSAAFGKTVRAFPNIMTEHINT